MSIDGQYRERGWLMEIRRLKKCSLLSSPDVTIHSSIDLRNRSSGKTAEDPSALIESTFKISYEWSWKRFVQSSYRIWRTDLSLSRSFFSNESRAPNQIRQFVNESTNEKSVRLNLEEKDTCVELLIRRERKEMKNLTRRIYRARNTMETV